MKAKIVETELKLEELAKEFALAKEKIADGENCKRQFVQFESTIKVSLSNYHVLGSK